MRKIGIEIKEYIGHEVKKNKYSNKLKNITESCNELCIADDSIMVDIEAIHSKITRNYTYYTPNCLKKSVPYWTKPYNIPVIMHHNEKDGEIIGRIHSVEYSETGTTDNLPALIFTANIGNEQGKKGIKNGTLSTVSIGAIAHDVRCSICGCQLTNSDCAHERGESYLVDDKEQLCYWIIEEIEPKEVSYVIVPSDSYAQNIRVYDLQNKKSEVKESMNNPFLELIEATRSNSESSKIIDEEIKKNLQDLEDKTQEEEAEKEEENKQEVEEHSQEESQEEVENKEESKEDEAEQIQDKKIEQLQKELEDIKKELENIKKENKSLQEEKSSLTEQVNTLKTENKKHLVSTIQSLREKLSLPKETQESLMEESEDTLKTNIKSLKEFSMLQSQTMALNGKLKSPLQVEENFDNTSKKIKEEKTNVNESNNNSNKNLEEQVISLIEQLI